MTELTGYRQFRSAKFGAFCLVAVVFMLSNGCSSAPKPATSDIKKLPSGQQFSGFLKDYSILKANPAVGGETLTFVHLDKMKSLRRYVAIIVDPVDVYVATDADTSLFTSHAREAVSNYFRHALIDAVEDAFPVVDTPGPLVLRLRAAVVGVDLGGELAPIESGSEPLKRALVREKVGVEMELVDSQTGEQIAAYVDKENSALAPKSDPLISLVKNEPWKQEPPSMNGPRKYGSFSTPSMCLTPKTQRAPTLLMCHTGVSDR